MKADLTRSTFHSEKHYSGVRMQQGRVQLDADWNEQVDIGSHLDETTRVDVIGDCGMPLHAAGFGISPLPAGGDLAVSAGRAYVEGILCENDASSIAVVELGDAELVLEGVVADGHELEEGDWIELSATGVDAVARRLAGVDAVQRAVKLEDPLAAAELSDLEKAGDAVVRRLVTYLTQPHLAGGPLAPDEVTPEAGIYLFYLDVWERHRTALEDGDLREVALGGPDHATRMQTVWQVKRARVGDPEDEVTCDTVPGWAEVAPGTTGRLRARAHPQTTADDLCTIPPGAGYRRGENQLYRVEIRKSGALGEAEFTFSRENGSVVVPWLDSDDGALTVSTVGRDEVLGFGPGDWIELTDDRKELAGEAGPLAKVATALGQVITIQENTATDSTDIAGFPLKPKVRRWDDPDGRRVVETPADNDGYLALEDGVEVRFEEGHYRALDYWLVPARTALGDVEWQADSAGTALARPPEGVVHHYCALAILEFGDGWQLVEDCRKLFPPLTEITGAAADEGVHVVQVTAAEKIELHNDGFITADQLAAGIEIHCDRDVEPGTLKGKPTCVVTLDLPFPANQADRALWGDQLIGTVPVTLTAELEASGSVIHWKPTAPTHDWLLQRLGAVLLELETPQLFVHLTLRGRFVYEAGDAQVDVDGEAFGELAGSRLDVVLPSGDGRRGGDLELWFRLRRPHGETPTGIVVLAVPTKSSVLTSKAKRSAIPKAIAWVVPRDELRAALPGGFGVDLDAVLNPARARTLVVNQRLAEPGTAATVVLAVEEPLQGSVEVVANALEKNDVPLKLEVVVVPSAAEIADRIMAGENPDLLLVSQQTLDAVSAIVPEGIAPEGTVVL